ncbi:hypothetical protein K2173_025817 [Erythroxylum novogranatense]|uniref:Uncharacterized protein n=1 Tax=Erythroxylum novogranatense TaxID=1862640 RepID=A0AAV8SHW3_9ROSI|nr:hypothetical protein K2173_025817 [Erythroxylum novogranatense]
MESDRPISALPDGLGDSVQRIRPMHGRTSGPTRRSTKGQWTAEEDEILRKAVQRFKGKNWKKIAECFKDRTDVQCLHRWQKVLNPELVKGPWSKEEDEIIDELVKKYGPKKWSTIAQHLPGRIGKQCRERWHNHLNPAINKEAWTQQEELTLIRAHQIYGNRWAELTKFLPGRTDNAIKNHWNSSVKKKLDSYLASGLLEQFTALPLPGPQNQSMLSSSRIQSSGEESGKVGAEAEEISECSQESMVAGCSQSASDMGNTALHTREDFQLPDESSTGKEQISSPEQYYLPIADGAFSIPEIRCEVGCPSNLFQQDVLLNSINSVHKDYQFSLQKVPNISSVEVTSSGLPIDCITANENDALVNIAANVAKSDRILISDDECCKFLFSEAMNTMDFPSVHLTAGPTMAASNGSTDSFLRNIPMSETEKTTVLQSFCPSREPNQLIGHSLGAHEQVVLTSANNRFICTSEAANSPCDGTQYTDMQVQSYLQEPSKLVPVNTFTSSSDAQSCAVDEKSEVDLEQQDAGTLCYEPPRFPCLDIPFLSCDLIQSGSDMHQEYSPLGIRQLMMSSMNCISPFRLWGSPSQDDSPEAMLKSAAKTFTCTPSILKKRNRDLLSPLSDRRGDKKLEIDTSGLTKEFSRLDVVFDESEANRISPSSNKQVPIGSLIEDKENLDPALMRVQEKGTNFSASDTKISETGLDSGKYEESRQELFSNDAKTKVCGDRSTEIVQEPFGSLVEDNLNDLLLFSPDQVGFKVDKAFGPSSCTPRNLYRRILGTLSEQANDSEPSSSGNPGSVNSPSVRWKNPANCSAGTTAVLSVPSSAPLDIIVSTSGNDAAGENFGVFGDTPFKRSIESPSAWKSPWFINSFLPGSRVDTDISIEDIGYLLSPDDKSYDALALMKQLSEHTAPAYADALEVLGNETPDSIMKARRSSKQHVDQENNNGPNQAENRASLGSNIMTECRILDFSECGTPGRGKGTEKAKSSSALGVSSPYLLKGCR